MARKSRKHQTPDTDRDVHVKVFNTAVYARLSIEDSRDKEGGSIDDQIDLVKKYIEGKEYLSLAGVFSDNGETGTDFKRPEFERLMGEIKNGNINCIAVKDLSRYGRNYLECGEYLEKIFPFLGVRFISILDNLDTFSPDYSGQTLMVALKNLTHDLYAKDVSRKIKAALDAKKRNGDFIGDYAPYGYIKSCENKNKLVIDDESAEIVRNIFRWALEGMTTPQIADRLNEMKIPSPQKYKILKGICKVGNNPRAIFWLSETVKAILRNQMYTGSTVNGKTRTIPEQGYRIQRLPENEWIVVPNTHEAIIPQRDFEAVAELLGKHKKSSNCGTKGKYRQPGWAIQENLFFGILFCAECGRPLHKDEYDCKTAREYRFSFVCLYCRKYQKNELKAKTIKQSDLQDIVFKLFKQQFETCADAKNIIDKVRGSKRNHEKISKLKSEANYLRQEIKKIESRCMSLYKDFQDDILTKDEYLYLRDKYSNEKTAFEARINEISGVQNKLEPEYIQENHWVKILGKFCSDKKLSREMVVALVERIEITRDRQVTIHFKYRDAYEEILEAVNENAVSQC